MLATESLSVAGRLEAVSASLRPGDLTAICGPNGAGKSSLLAALAGVLRPGAGTASLDGAPLDRIPPRQRAQAIGYLPQAGEAAWDMNVATLVSLGRLPWRTSAAEDAAAVGAALAAMEMEGLADRPLSKLSGGERARALLGRVLAGQPRWILADEPLAALDIAHAARLMAHLRGAARGGRGVVVVLHDLAQAMNHADRVLVLDAGRLIADAPPTEALAAPVIAQVWGAQMRWLGQPGGYALAPDI